MGYKNKFFICYRKSLKLDKKNSLRIMDSKTVFTQNKNRCEVYRSLSTDFTSLSSFAIYTFAISKHTIEINENSGSIPFSGKSIPPGKFSNQ